MKEQWLKLKEWHANLQARERRIVNIGGAVVAFALFYLLFWSPFLNRVDDLRQHMGNQMKTLAWMKATDQQIKQLEGGGTQSKSNLSPVAMLAFLQSQIKLAGMKDALTELKQASNDSIQMQFKNVSFDQLIKLLISVIKNQQVTISQFSAEADATPGMVNASVIINLST